MCKAISVLETPTSDSDLMDRIKKSLETNLKSQHVFARSSALHGALYLMQTSERLVSLFCLAFVFSHHELNDL